MTVGERIKSRRKQLNISADKLAEAIGVSRSTMFRYENGDIEKLPGDTLVPIAQALHTTPAYLMGWERSPEEEKALAPERDEREREIMEIFEKLPDKEKEKFVQLARLLAKE